MKHPIKYWHVEILASGFLSKEELNEAEIFYIKKFNSRTKGYNVTKGGDGGPGWQTGRTISQKTKNKLSRINSGRKHPRWGTKDSLETRLKKSRAAEGNKGNLGKLFSKKHKKGIAKAQRDAWSNYTPQQRKNRCDTMRQGWINRLDAKRFHKR